MKQIDKSNYKQFLSHYNDFHDGYIEKIDVEDHCIYITFDLCSNGNTILNNKDYLERRVKLRMLFKGVNNFSENNPYLIDYIDYTYIDFFNKNEKSVICFSLNSEEPDEDPYLYIICEDIEYEEIDY